MLAYKRYMKIYVACLCFCFISIGIGFILSQCYFFPKELRGGVLDKFDRIGVISQETNDIVLGLKLDVERLKKVQKSNINALYKQGILKRKAKN